MRVPRANAPRARAIRRDQPGTGRRDPARLERVCSRERCEGAETLALGGRVDELVREVAQAEALDGWTAVTEGLAHLRPERRCLARSAVVVHGAADERRLTAARS